MNYYNYFSRINIFNKNYKNISISESSENLLNSIQNISNINKTIQSITINKTDSVEFTDFEQAITIDDTIQINQINQINNNNEIELFANFDDFNDNFIESYEYDSNNIFNFISEIVNDIIDNISNEIIINHEVKNTINDLIELCEDFYKKIKYELIGSITDLLYRENNIAYVVSIDDREQFKKFKFNNNIYRIQGIFYWDNNQILKSNDKVLVECTYIGNYCSYKLNKIIKKL